MPKDTAFTIDQYEKVYPKNIELHYWHQARNRIILNELNQGVKYLEIGCGTGSIVRFLRSKKVQCYGVELAKINFESDIQSHCISGTSAELLPNTFREGIEGILLLDVIEHIENPKEFIYGLLGKFPSIKHLLITVPSRQELWSNFDMYHGHFLRYTPDTLLANLNLNEWSHYKMHYAFKIFYLPMLITSKFNINRNIGVRVPKSKLHKYFHKMLGLFLYYESFIFKDIPGSSLVLSLHRNSKD